MAAMSISDDLRRTPQPAPSPGPVYGEKAQLPSIIIDSPSSYDSSGSSTRQRICAAWSNIKMPSFRQFFFAFLAAAFLSSVYARRPIHLRSPGVALSGPGDESAFQDLLSQVSDTSLHEVLHDVSDKYKHGVYPEDRMALQEIHKDNPAMATSLVKLARRQNGTVTAVESITSTATVVVLPTESASTIIVTVSPTDTTGQTATDQNPPGSQPSTQGATTLKTTGAGPGTSKTTGASSPGRSSSPGAVSTSISNSNPTSISAGGSSAGKTSGPGNTPTPTTQQIIFTTTLPNGGRSTVTSFTIVPAGEQAATPGTSASVTGTPSLQNSAIRKGNPSSVKAIWVFLAALVFFMGVL